MENELPPADLPEDSVTRIEAAQARAIYDLRVEVRQYWLSICASESQWKKAQPTDLAPMFGRYLVAILDAYARETLPQSISEVDKFLESLKVRRTDELIGRILPQKGVKDIPIIGYRQTLEIYEKSIAGLLARSKTKVTEDVKEFLWGESSPGGFFSATAVSPRALPDPIPNSPDGLWETVILDTWQDVRRERVLDQYWPEWDIHPFQYTFRAATTDDLLPKNSLWTRFFKADLARATDRDLELWSVKALEALARARKAIPHELAEPAKRAKSAKAKRSPAKRAKSAKARPSSATRAKSAKPQRFPSSVTSPIAARRMDDHLKSDGIGLTEFAVRVGTTDRTLRSFRKTGKVLRSIFDAIAKEMGTTREALLKPE